MLVVPTSGFARSINVHNIKLEIFCDWIEASILFSEYDILSTTDVVDALVEGEIYASQDFAREMVDNGWRELERRQSWMGASSPIEVVGQRVRRTKNWHDCAGYSFLMVLSLARLYPDWAGRFGRDFTEQGMLFEELTEQALHGLFPGWEVFITGWSRERVNKLGAVVREVASRVNEPIGNIGRWTREDANEAGLDVLCYYGFKDGKGGYPVYLFQCASGIQWEQKIHTPDIKIWSRIIEFPYPPKKAFVMPFAIPDDEFVRVCNRIDGLLLDRYRILFPGVTNPDWIDIGLSIRLVDWIRKRTDSLAWDHE